MVLSHSKIRLITFLAAAIMVLGIAGCGSGSASPTASPTAVKAPQPPRFPTFTTARPGNGGSSTPHPGAKAGPSATPELATEPPLEATEAGDEPIHPIPPTPIPPTALLNTMKSVQQITWDARNSGGMLPNGCAAISGQQVCVPKITIDGTRIPDVDVLSQRAGRGTGPTAGRISIAFSVLSRLFYLEGLKSGIKVTDAQARQVAEAQLSAYQKNPTSRSATPLPRGVSPREYFLDPSTIASYRTSLVMAQKRTSLLQSQMGKGADIFAVWLQGQLKHHTVLVNGKPPAFSLPDTIRADYACAVSATKANCPQSM
jgi:hypothetical protein